MKYVLVVLFLASLLVAPLHAETIQFDENWGPAGITVEEQFPTGFVVNFSMPRVSFHTQLINGEPMTVINMPCAMLGNDEHAPNLPGIGRFFAVPQGATFALEIKSVRTRLIKNKDIAPARVIPLDTDDSMPEYKKDPLIYGTNAYYPAAPVKVSEPRIIRGVDAGVLGITPFQYNPVTKDLLVYSDIKVEVTFLGGNGRFGEDRLRNPYFDPILQAHLINANQLPEINYTNRHARAGAGEAEYVIIVPDSGDYKKWAMVMKDFRLKQGIVTEIYSLAQVGYNSNDIKNWIHNAVKNWSLPPVAVLLMGDAPGEGAPSIPVPFWSWTPSDNIYADVYGNDDLPDIVTSRICAKTLADLEEMVMKVIDYETSPPTNPTFYDCPTAAAGWQSDRWFVICADIVHGYFNHGLARNPNREYSGYSGTPSYWSTNQNTYMLVDYFGSQGLGYIPDTPNHLNQWNANSTSINACLNAGSFLALHRDHGSPDGWSDPY
ncbi:MAG: C25 family cysteine peptidase, partial [Planctomycetota bacterium]